MRYKVHRFLNILYCQIYKDLLCHLKCFWLLVRFLLIVINFLH